MNAKNIFTLKALLTICLHVFHSNDGLVMAKEITAKYVKITSNPKMKYLLTCSDTAGMTAFASATDNCIEEYVMKQNMSSTANV